MADTAPRPARTGGCPCRAARDAPDDVLWAFHIWESRRIPWFVVRDDLPRNAAFRPHTPGLEDGSERALTGTGEP
ncbi:hypothetical protein [Phenylobacterium sp.]|uniref:hypothetical protein n=1 Tax=Phenylobacterium sp. TaxID=1871053 RepID=UPI002E305FD4|nr:hypothetical protein [Phenylobacterium sp.]